jgi:hypothetical protein
MRPSTSHTRTLCRTLLTFRIGAWVIHPILILCLKILYDIVPGISQETSWTLTNLTYIAGSYLMFHWVRGIPFDFNSGAYDNLNMWEQIDNGDQYTPAKKYLLAVPIVLFLVSTHYTHYDLRTFLINLLATVAVIIPKLPAVCLLHMLPLSNTNHTTVSPITNKVSLRRTRGWMKSPTRHIDIITKIAYQETAFSLASFLLYMLALHGVGKELFLVVSIP